MIPNLCISDAKEAFIKAIARTNRLKLSEKGLKMRYVQAWFTSWIEITIELESDQLEKIKDL